MTSPGDDTDPPSDPARSDENGACQSADGIGADDGSDATQPADESSVVDVPADRFADEALPADVLRAVERLTRLARRAVDENEREAYCDRRDALLADHGYTARIREDDDTLVCYPDEWLDDGVVHPDRIDDLSDAVELSLAGPGDPDDWDALDARNRELVAAVCERHGPVHGANAEAFADFMGNHYAKPIPSATGEEIEEFLGEYYVRNAWPSPAERSVVTESIERLFESSGEPLPTFDVPATLETG